MALHSKIILGLIFGLIVGIISVFMGIGEYISDWIMPFGTIFVKMLKLVAGSINISFFSIRGFL